MDGLPLAKSVVASMFETHLQRRPSGPDLETEARRLLALGITIDQYEAGILASDEYALRQRLSATTEIIPFDGCQFRLPTFSLLAGAMKTPQGYEPWVLPEFLSLCRPGMVVVDVGANWGVFSIPAARRVSDTGHVWAFEANNHNAEILLGSVEMNALANLELIPAAVSEHFGFAFLRDNEPTNAGIVEFGKCSKGRIVPTVTLDAALSGVPRLDLIKMDIEGSEYRACLGARELIDKFRPTVFLEFCPLLLEQHTKPLLEFFLGRNYRITALPPWGARRDMTGSRDDIVRDAIAMCDAVNTHVDLRFSP